MKVPVIILHEMDDTQYKIGGELIAINESNDTCTVRFRNGRVEDSIPMDCIYIREGFLDTVKEYGRKVAAWIIGKVKGLFKFETDVEEDAFQHPINMIASAANGLTPSFAEFYPAQTLTDLAEQAGISYTEPGENDDPTGQIAKEAEEINRYWSRVMNIAGTTDKTIEESIQYVNESYYKNVFGARALNEAGTPSLRPAIDNVKDDKAAGAEGRKNNDGIFVNTEGLKAAIYETVSGQLKLSYQGMLANMDAAEAGKFEENVPADAFDDDDDDDDDDYMDDPRYQELMAAKRTAISKKIKSSDNSTRSLLIWGAPGIGKTQIVKQVIKDFCKHPITPVNLHMYYMNCANVDGDAFGLPLRRDKNGRDITTEEDVINMAPLAWLPVYSDGDEEHNEEMEKKFALCQHLTSDGRALVNNETGEVMQGGVIFLDEIVRAHRSGLVALMAVADRNFSGRRMARSWAVICAANRDAEDVTQEAIDMMESSPIVQRFRHVTFIPEKEEWVKWARSVNRDGVANIEPEIVNFVEAMPTYIWYRTIDFGGYDRELELIKDELDIDGPLYVPDGGGVYQETIDALKSLTKDGKNPLAKTKQVWNGRTWDEVSEEYRHALQDLLNNESVPQKYHYEQLQIRSYMKENYPGISPNMLQKALKHIPEEHWQWWVKTYLRYYSNADVRDACRGNLTPAQRMEKVRHALIGIVKKATGSGDSGIDKTAPVSMLEDYYSWRRIFEEDGLTDAIFNTGYLPKAYQMKDNASPLDPEGFKWKNDSAIVDEVNKFIISQYPGSKSGAMSDWRKYFEVVNPAMKTLYQKLDFVSVWKINPDMQKKIESVIEGVLGDKLEKPTDKQMKDIFVLKTGTAYGDVQLIALDKLNPVIQKVIFKLYNNFDFVKYLVNYTKYRIKIDFTRDTFNMTGGYMLNDDYRIWLSKNLGLTTSSEFDQEVKDLERTTNLIIGNGQNKNGTSSNAINLQSNGTITDVIHFNVFKLLQIMLMEANNA